MEILNNYISVTFVYTDNNNPFDSIGKLVERSIDEIREKQTKLVHEANSRLLSIK